jgi:2-polyprenyl-3-methyl-5-hydroxy-6-metoxy-1,4-benzoquinol methylase
MEEIGDFYPEEYGPYKVTRENQQSWIARLDHSYGYWKRARLVNAAYPQGGRILDVGCASGDFLHMMDRMDHWQVHGVEVSAEASGYGRDCYGLEICTGELADAHHPDSYFDVITIWDVLEHVHDPTGTLSEMHRILKPNGLAIIRVPNLSTWDARLFGRYWVGLDAPRHLYVLSAKTLTALLHKTGFQVRQLRSVMLGYLPFALSVQFWAEERLHNRRVKEAILALNRSWLPRLLTRPFFTLLGYVNSSTFAVAAFATRARSEPGL